MKKLLLILLPLAIVCLGGCEKWISIWDNVYCAAWVVWYSWKVIYAKREYIVVDWIKQEMEYWEIGNCPVKETKYWCMRDTTTTWQYILHKIKDYCYREWNYDDIINLKLEQR